jgi:hypothetical protein
MSSFDKNQAQALILRCSKTYSINRQNCTKYVQFAMLAYAASKIDFSCIMLRLIIAHD